VDDLADYIYPEEHVAFLLPMFNPSSPWNTRVPDNYQVDPNSDAMIEKLIADHDSGTDVMISVHDYSCPIYFADKNTPY